MTSVLRTALRLVAVLGVVAVVALPAPASAHATLVGSNPRQDQRLGSLPQQVSFEFNQDMSAPAYVIVTAPDGSSVTEGDPVVDGPLVTQAIEDGPDGAYTMAYRAVSADGHPVTGEITFSVGDPADTRPSSGSASQPSLSPSASSSGPAVDRAGEVTHDDAGRSSRGLVAVVVGVGLFLSAAVLVLLSRRVGS